MHNDFFSSFEIIYPLSGITTCRIDLNCLSVHRALLKSASDAMPVCRLLSSFYLFSLASVNRTSVLEAMQDIFI